jgi:hypothetical protein
MWMWRKAKAVGSGVPTDLAGCLAALIEIVEQGIRAQPNAEETIAECCRAGEIPPEVARRGGRIVSEYARLHRAAADLAAAADPGSLQARVAELLIAHASTVDECLKLAFSQFWIPKADRRGHSHTGLGEPARTLREAGVALRMWLADLEAKPEN